MNILSLPRRILKYIRTDLKEIALPSSLPDPPDYVPPRRTTWIERWQALKGGTKSYLATWKSELEEGAAATKNDSKEKEEATVLEELAATAKSSSNLRPLLAKLYQSQMTAYQQAVKSFVEGYREGAAEKVDLSGIFPVSDKQLAVPSERTAEQTGSSSDAGASRATSGAGSRQAETPLVVSKAEQALTSVDAPAEHNKLIAKSLNDKREAQRAMLRSLSAGFGASKAGRDLPYSDRSESPSVQRALDQAEQLAAAVLGGGGTEVTAAQRRELEMAIEHVEAAMHAASATTKNDVVES